MLGISDLYKELRYRMSSPLFSSFAISWLVINWEIPIGLIFYKQSDLIADGYISYIDLICKSYNVYESICLPLTCAILYVILSPVLRNLISAINTWAQNWGEKLNIRLSKNGAIAIEKYLELRTIFNSQQQELQSIIDEESTTTNELNELKRNYNELGLETEMLKKQLLNWKKANDVSKLDGNWEFTPNDRILEKKKVYRINIQNGNIHFMNNDNEIQSEKRRVINWFFINPEINEITILLDIYKSDGQGGEMYYESKLQKLKAIDDFNILEGYELKDKNPIKYIRTT